MATLGHPLSIRISLVQVERELREVLAGAWAAMRAALDAAELLVTAAAGGANAAMTFPFARSHLRELARYHSGPLAPATRESWLAHLRLAWRDIDSAIAAVPEIRFEARQAVRPRID